MPHPSRLRFDPSHPLPVVRSSCVNRTAAVPFSVTGVTLAFLGFSVVLTVTPASVCYLPALPRVETAEQLGLPQTADISVDQSGLVYLEDPRPVPERALPQRLTALRSRRSADHHITVSADERSPYGPVLAILDAAAAAGAREVILLTELPREAPASIEEP